MVDIVDKATRSKMMAGIRGRDTKPEILVRRFLHKVGLRFRLKTDLVGRPDLVLPKHQAVVFVHGCYWHRHPGCKYATSPSSNRSFWKQKFRENVARDKRVQISLERNGWRVFVVWECELETRRLASLARDIRKPVRQLAAKSSLLK